MSPYGRTEDRCRCEDHVCFQACVITASMTDMTARSGHLTLRRARSPQVKVFRCGPRRDGGGWACVGRREKPPKEEAAGAGWSAYGESVQLRFLKVAIGGNVSRRRVAAKACDETIGIGWQLFRRLASAVLQCAGFA
jgi:hypothetical protein